MLDAKAIFQASSKTASCPVVVKHPVSNKTNGEASKKRKRSRRSALSCTAKIYLVAVDVDVDVDVAVAVAVAVAAVTLSSELSAASNPTVTRPAATGLFLAAFVTLLTMSVTGLAKAGADKRPSAKVTANSFFMEVFLKERE